MQISTPITPMHGNANYSCHQKVLVCETLLNKQPFPNYRKKKTRDSIDIGVDISGWCTSVLISVVTEDNSQEPVNNTTRVLQFHGPHPSHNGAENLNISL